MTPTERQSLRQGDRVTYRATEFISHGTITGIDARLITIEWDDGQITHETTNGRALAYLSVAERATP